VDGDETIEKEEFVFTVFVYKEEGVRFKNKKGLEQF
jgi:hypothetical protein